MDRFTYREKDEPKIIAYCAYEKCDEPIYSGDKCVEYEDMLFCDINCLFDGIGVKNIIAGSDDE